MKQPFKLKMSPLSKRVIMALSALFLLFVVVRPPFRHARTVAASSLAATVFLRGRRLRLKSAAGEDSAVVNVRNGDSLLIERTLETVETELRETDAALRQLQDTYRNVARLHREQKTQIAALQTGQKALEIAATAESETDECAALLNLVMDALDAGGGVFWRRVPGSASLEVAAAEGRVLPVAHFGLLEDAANLSAPELRARCEDQLEDACPALPPQLRLPLSAEEEEAQSAARMKPLQPILITLLRAESRSEELGEITGALGLCEPRGMARFNAQDTERIYALAPALAKALQMLETRRADRRRLSEITTLYDLSRLMESASDIEQIYKATVAQVAKIIPCENTALFLLDKPSKKLELRAARGRAVNLLEHFAFEKGKGVSGWVASRGKPIVINDMDRAPNVLNSDSLPARVRSFAAIPMRVNNNVIGVLHLSDSGPNAFSPDDIRLLSLIAGQAAVTIDRMAAHQQLETLAITDGLTRVYNHRYFQMRLEDELRRCKRYRLPLSLLIIDADHFKNINDIYGHASGDAVLRDMGNLLRECMRDTEIVARLGGEEFGVLLPQTDEIQAQIAAERLRASVEAHDFRSVDGQPIQVTISLGIAGFPPNATRADLMEQADRAMYAAKRSGRNRVVAADPPTLALVSDSSLIAA